MISSVLEIMGEKNDNDAISKEMKLAMIQDMPIRALRSFKGVDNYMIETLVKTLNHLIN